MNRIYRVAILGLSAIVASCSGGSNKWHLNGTINGLSEDDTVVLQGNNQGYWYTIDTIATGKDGKFNYVGDVHGYPDIFRINVGESSVYFPIDSIETVTINATAPDIAANHTLGGSAQALNLTRVDSLISASAVANGVTGIASDEGLKRQLGDMIVADPAGVVSYYIISKSIGSTPLFDASQALDRRLIGAVANAFNNQRPDDPRTKYLTNLYLNSRRSVSNPNPVEVNLIKGFEINLYDNEGKQHSLLELTDKGNPVILSFTAYMAEWSPAFNLELNKVYEKYHSRGLEIYQVSLDSDEYFWKQSAKNLPWITVLYNMADGDKVIRQYNVGSLPTTFVFNRDGDLVERVLDIAELDSAVAKCL